MASTGGTGFPALNARASLKLCDRLFSILATVCFPALNARASLKHRLARWNAGRQNRFPALNARASLKRPHVLGEDVQGAMVFPRLMRGPH